MMDSSLVIELVFQALFKALMMSAPILLSMLIVGLLISIVQAATQLNETTLAFVPKILVVVVVILVAGPSILTLMSDYVRELILRIPSITL